MKKQPARQVVIEQSLNKNQSLLRIYICMNKAAAAVEADLARGSIECEGNKYIWCDHDTFNAMTSL